MKQGDLIFIKEDFLHFKKGEKYIFVQMCNDGLGIAYPDKYKKFKDPNDATNSLGMVVVDFANINKIEGRTERLKRISKLFLNNV